MALAPCVEGDTRLLVRCFPPSLSPSDKEDFLRHFGATDVTCMPKQSKLMVFTAHCDTYLVRMRYENERATACSSQQRAFIEQSIFDISKRYCAFASFPSSLDAHKHSFEAGSQTRVVRLPVLKALVRLHQLKIIENRLVVVYARPEHVAEEERVRKENDSSEDDEDEPEAKGTGPPKMTVPCNTAQPDRIQPVCGAFVPSSLGSSASSCLPSSHVSYRYPPVSASIITNVAHTLACVPQFYTQVLHLMNKMNLPPPFGPVTPTPPVHGGDIRAPAADIAVMSSASSSESGSELEDDQNDVVRHFLGGQAKPIAVRKPRPVKRRRFVASTDTSAGLRRTSEQPVDAESVFDSTSQGKKQVDLSSLIQSAVRAGQAALESSSRPEQETNGDAETAETAAPEKEEPDAGAAAAGFGTFAPAPQITVEDHGDDSDDLMTALLNTVSRQELQQGRLSQSDMNDANVFKSYSPGEPSCRLYVKNLGKQVTEEDLRFIFGRFVDRESSEHMERFNIRLMQEGRMKGQAFITLADEEIAEKARKETNGFVLQSKPLVVQFARSARAKS